MAKIFENQTALQLRLRVYEDLTGKIERALIKYRKPNGIEGFWTAEVIDWTNGVIAYTIPAGDLETIDDTGFWTLWAYIYYKDGSVSPGEAVQIGVYQEGKAYIAFPYGRKSSVGEETQMAQEAFEIIYNNTNSGMTATNVQDALDELKDDVDGVNSTADAIHFDNTASGLAAANLQDAVDQVDANVDVIGLLLAQAGKSLYVDMYRSDSYTEIGSIQQPFKTLSGAVSIATAGTMIYVSSGAYVENIPLPNNVSLTGTGIGQTVIAGDLSTGTENCSLKNLSVTGDLTINGPCTLYDVRAEALVTINQDTTGFNFTVNTPSGPALTITHGLVMLDSGLIWVGGTASAIVQTAGTLVLNNYRVENDSGVNPTISSTSGSLRLTQVYVENGSGVAIDADNGATYAAPNILSQVRHMGSINVGSAYTIQDGVFDVALTGTGFIKRPADQIAYTPATGLTATDVQTAIDEVWSSCKKGTTPPAYTPTKSPELYLDTVAHTLYIYDTAWHGVNLPL